MALKDVLGAVLAILNANGSITDTTLYLQANAAKPRTVPPSLVWVVGRDSYAPPNAAMPRAQQQAVSSSAALARPLHTRWAGVEAHLWASASSNSAIAAGDDYSATETLLNAVISAVHQTIYGGYQLQGGGMVNPRSSEGSVLGHRYVLNFAIAIPVFEIQEAAHLQERVQVTTITQTDAMGPIPPGGSTTSTTP